MKLVLRFVKLQSGRIWQKVDNLGCKDNEARDYNEEGEDD